MSFERKQRVALVLGIICLATLCAAAAQKTTPRTQELRADGDEVSARWTDEASGATVTVEARGELTLTEDETDVESLSRQGYLLVSEARGDSVRALEVTPDGDGRPRRRYTVNGVGRELDAEGRAWLARLLPEVASSAGVGARARARRLVNQRGASAVVSEMSRFSSNSVKRLYAEELFRQAASDPELLRQLPQRVLGQITSNGEKANLLIKHADLYLNAGSAADAYFEAVGTLSSSGERRRVVSALMKRPDLSDENLLRVLRAVGGINSSGEKAGFLLEFSSRFVHNAAVAPSFYETVNSIGSGGERARVLSELVKRR
jgi:hypothetical protein